MIDPAGEWETWRAWLGAEPQGQTIYAEIVEMLAFRKIWLVMTPWHVIFRTPWIPDERWTEVANQVEQLGAEDLAHPGSPPKTIVACCCLMMLVELDLLALPTSPRR